VQPAKRAFRRRYLFVPGVSSFLHKLS
jgi:hypothetical protein